MMPLNRTGTVTIPGETLICVPLKVIDILFIGAKTGTGYGDLAADSPALRENR
jgi:hypothetical protein